MNQLTPEDIARVKGLGFLRNRGTDQFSGRVVARGAAFSADDLTGIAACAKAFGVGEVAITSRMGAEIVGIPFDRIDEAAAYLAAHTTVRFGGTGPRVRPIVACKGTTCVFGCCDTRGIARSLHDQCYVGMADVVLPHKFKMAVGGCPNSCVKPTLNDFSVEARRGAGFQVYVGGTWGRTKRMGTPLTRLIAEEEIVPTAIRCIEWYRANGLPKERLGATIDRLGLEALEAALGQP